MRYSSLSGIVFSLLTATAPLLSGATIVPIISFSNFTAVLTVSSPDIYASGFSQGAHYILPPGQGVFGLPIAPDSVQVWLDLGGGGTMRSTSVAQRIDATASLDFTLSGYQTSRIDIYGAAKDDGALAGEMHGISGPCTAWISGSDHNWAACSSPGAQSGTITARMYMYTDASSYRADTASLAGLSVLMTLTPAQGGIHQPEPSTIALAAIGIVLIILAKGRRRP